MYKRLNNIIFSLLNNFFKIFTFGFSVTKFYDLIYSAWIASRFLKIGNNFRVRRFAHLYGCNYVSIGNSFTSGPGLRIECWEQYLDSKFIPNLVIGDNVTLNFNCHLACINQIIFGDNVLIGSNVFITDHFHGKIDLSDVNIPPSYRKLYSKGPVVIEDNVWIGENVTILPNVKIGFGSIIGANTVVTKSFPPFSVIIGNPGRLLKTLGA